MIPVDVRRFADCRLLVIGDLMLDEYIWGRVDRISPEAPVQVVAVNRQEYTLGGAGNVVNNLAALGAAVSAVGVIGAGADGQLLLERFRSLGLDVTGIIQEPGRLTTKKTRVIAASQHVLRIDWETQAGISTATYEALTRLILKKIPAVDGVLISDYGKGLLTHPLLTDIFQEARRRDKFTIVDPKGRDYRRYQGAHLLTPNKKEAATAAGVDIVDPETLAQAGRILMGRTGTKRLLMTCGKEGMVLFEGAKAPFRIRSEARQVFDVSGAGDTVLSVLGLALATGADLRNAAALANTAAGIVVGKVGTATVSLQELETAYAEASDPAVGKHIQTENLPALVKALRHQGLQIVLTNGCFDLLHVGHIQLLSRSKQLGDVLIVAIDDDASVRELKGPGRPVINDRQRVRIISAIDSVDYVVVFSSQNLMQLIEMIRPDILTKGSDYVSDEVFGRERVESLGGRVVIVPVTENVSAARMIDNIKNSD